MTSADVSGLLGAKLLQGWAMLNEYCPQCVNVPLMRSRDGNQKVCVSCESKPIEKVSFSVSEPALQNQETSSFKMGKENVQSIVECLAGMLENIIGHKSQRTVDFDDILKAIKNYHLIYQFSDELKERLLSVFEKEEHALSIAFANLSDADSQKKTFSALLELSELHLQVMDIFKN